MQLDINRPISESALSPGRAAAAGLTVAVVVVGGIWGFNSLRERVTPDPTTAPLCYGREEAYVPKNEVIPLRGARQRGEASIDARYEQGQVERILELEKECRVDACSPESLGRYRSAVFWYLSGRLRHTRKLDRDYGSAGLRRAQQIYGEAADIKIERGLRDRYNARMFRINDFRQNRDAITILVLKGGAALRPCHIDDLKSV